VGEEEKGKVSCGPHPTHTGHPPHFHLENGEGWGGGQFSARAGEKLSHTPNDILRNMAFLITEPITIAIMSIQKVTKDILLAKLKSDACFINL
jgi:hypothetical protein